MQALWQSLRTQQRTIGLISGTILLFLLVLGFIWSYTPANFDVAKVAQQQAQAQQQQVVAGYTLTTALLEVGDRLLHKNGGYLSNDKLPPGLLMDNMPAWEFGVLEMLRDLSLAMRKDFSRSQSQSLENPLLVKAQPKFNIDSRSWLFPAAESEYAAALDLFAQYRSQLADPQEQNSQFYTRADNLREWLKQVEKRLGSMSQILSASVGQEVINTDLAGDATASQSTPSAQVQVNKTAWSQLDDNFYQARGMSYALLHFLKAVEVDFADVLRKKNATVSLQQIIRELEATQQTVFSPMILNGSGFGLFANHSLVMANYISRANAGIIELSELLNQG